MTKQMTKQITHNFKNREEYLKSDLVKKDYFGNKNLTFGEFKVARTILFCGECGRPMGLDEKLYQTEAYEHYSICKDCVDAKGKEVVNSHDVYHYKNDEELYNSYIRYTGKLVTCKEDLEELEQVEEVEENRREEKSITYAKVC